MGSETPSLEATPHSTGAWPRFTSPTSSLSILVNGGFFISVRKVELKGEYVVDKWTD
jgi:hypothetical protein